MQKHIYMVKDVLCFEHSVLLRREIISLQTTLNVLKLSRLQNSIKSSRVHIHTYTLSGVYIHTHQTAGHQVISSILKMGTELIPETLENFHTWRQLSTQEGFITQ